MKQFDTQVTRMILAVVHSQDSEIVELALEQEGISYVKFPSTGQQLQKSASVMLLPPWITLPFL